MPSSKPLCMLLWCRDKTDSFQEAEVLEYDASSESVTVRLLNNDMALGELVWVVADLLLSLLLLIC